MVVIACHWNFDCCVSPVDTSSVEVLDWHLDPFLDLPKLESKVSILYLMRMACHCYTIRKQFIPHQDGLSLLQISKMSSLYIVCNYTTDHLIRMYMAYQ